MSGHTITITREPDSDDVHTTITCPTDGSCPRVWLECENCPEPPPEGEDPWDWYSDPRHGVVHENFDGWCVETDRCYVIEIDAWNGCDGAWDTPDGMYVLDYEGGAMEDSFLIIGARIEEDR